MYELVIKTNRPRVETLLKRFRDVLGDDYDGYRNHVYRTITYAMYFLHNSADHEPLVETVFVYHDLGLWTHRALAYLEPSEALALDDNDKYGWGFPPEALTGAIHWHHKVFRYRGPHAQVIEACRKADWIDATQGWFRKGIDGASIRRVEAAFANCGFHRSLLRMAKDYSGSTLIGLIKVTRGIVKW